MTVTPIEQGRKTEGSVAPEPSNGSVTQERYNRAVAALRAYKDSTGQTWEDLAQALGGECRGNSLSVFASGKYSGAGALVERVEHFLALVEERRSLITQPEFVFTSVSKRIFAIIKQSLLLTKIGVIGAESGTGKSRTLQEWSATHPNTTYMRANRTFCPATAASRSASSPVPTLLHLGRAVGCVENPYQRSATMNYELIVKTLRGSNRLVIIDEAHFLPSEALDVIRNVHEEANVPMVLAGHLMMYDRAPREFEATLAFQSRCIREKIHNSQIRPSDIDLIASQLVGVDVARDAAKVLLQEAQAKAGFRRLVTILQLAQTYRHGDEPVTRAYVLRAIEERPEDGAL